MSKKLSTKYIRDYKNTMKYFEIKKSLSEWVNTITLHGLRNFFRTNYISIRIVWAIAFIISSTLCYALIIQNVLNYFKFEVNTKIRVLEQ